MDSMKYVCQNLKYIGSTNKQLQQLRSPDMSVCGVRAKAVFEGSPS